MESIKTISFFLILITFALSLGACQRGNPAVDPDTPYGDLEALDPSGALVIYWHALTGADEDHLLEMIDDFNAENDWGITVVGEYQGDLETLYTRVTAGLATNQLPSIVMTAPNLAAAYAAQNAAVALSPYLRSTKWGYSQEKLDDFFPSAFKSDRLPQFKNQLFSFPACRSLQILYYNRDWLKELGYDAPPQTWETFREIACAASKPADGLYGYEMGMDSLTFVNILASQDAAPLNQDASAYTLGGEVGRATLQLLQDLIQEGCALWETDQGSLADFSAGKVLFAIHSTDELTDYAQKIAGDANFDWALSPLPHTTEEPVIGVRGFSLAILRNTPEKQLAAWLFIKWLSEPEQQVRWSQKAACFPIRRSALEVMDIYLTEHPQHRLASQLLEEEWIAEPAVTGYAACRGAISRMLYTVTAGESVEQWLSETRTLCNQTLADTAD